MALAREAAERGVPLVLAAGGDGTLGEVTNGLAGTPTILAPLPVGTSNSFARELHMPLPGLFQPHRLLQTTAVLAKGCVQAMDLGFTQARAGEGGNGRYWLLWTGVGADSVMVNRWEPRPKWSKRIGPASYLFLGLPSLADLPPLVGEIEADGQIYSGEFLLVLISNSRRYAGGFVTLSPRAYLDDGLFEVWLLPGHGALRTARYLTDAWRGALADHPEVTHLRARQIAIRATPPFPIQTDGERAGLTPLTITVKPRALRLLVPSTAPRDLFVQAGVPLAEA
jgi:diacylglycerol kinase (ATP)